MQAELRAVTAERDHLKRREKSIIGACERVADGGQCRADIVSAIQRIRRERDEARADLAAARAEIRSLKTYDRGDIL